MDGNALLGQEWQTLQDNHEQHERNALLIKLSALALCFTGLFTQIATTWIAILVLLCWGLEGIFKTYQSRLADRLLVIEALIRHTPPTPAAMQLHSSWATCRPGGARLLVGYALSACRPTVTFPYLPLLLLLGIGRWLSWH